MKMIKKLNEGGDKMKKEKNKMVKFTESLNFAIQEGTINEEKHTIRVCALAPCVSKNNRYYSPSVVEGASGTLVGKKCFADHDVRDTKNLIGKIVSESYENGKLYADIKLSKAKGIARETWDKITDGTITDVSIAANGDERRMKLGDRIVSEVMNLDIRSVDFVPEGGVAEAKVQQVFENIKDIPEISEVKEEMIENLEQLTEKYPDLVAEAVAKKDTEIAALSKKVEETEMKLVEKELAEFKKTEIDKLEVNEKVKEIISEKVTGKNEEEISANIKVEFESIKKYEEAFKLKAKVKGIPEVKKEEPKEEVAKPWTKDRIMEEAKIPETLKVQACERLVLEGSESMLTWLKGRKIEL